MRDSSGGLFMDNNMGKLLFLLVLVLCTSGTLQKEGRRRVRDQKNSPQVAIPRILNADYVTSVNETRANNSAQSPEPLQLRHNSTLDYLRGPLSTRVIPIIYLLVVTVGIPANISILCLLATKIRKVSSAILYCSLAVSDLLLLSSLLFKAHYHLHGNHWVLGEAACRVVTACFYGNLYCSALTLACISIKRYLAVVHPFMYKSLPKRTCAAYVSLAVWGVFGVAIVPELLLQQSYRLPQLNITTCHDVLPLDHGSHVFLTYYNLILTIVCLLLPLVVTVVCFVRIIPQLNRSNHDWARYIKASSLVFAIFLVCFVPAGVLHFLHYMQLSVNGADNLHAFFSVAVCLCCLHSCLDPFLFLLMSKSAGSKLFFMTFKGKTLSISI